MSSVLGSQRPNPLDARNWSLWWPIGIGVAALYAPTIVDLSRSAWQQDEGSHGPIILAIIGWLLWQAREAFQRAPDRPATVSGSLLLGFGLLCYVLGRSQGISPLEVGSMIPVLAGTVLVARGWSALRVLAFPLLFLIFLVPLPGLLVTAITGPLKQYVSVVVEELLYAIGYPIGRSGVTLTVGPYQLLVADACSGLNSIYSLSALGLLYLYLMRYRNWLRVTILLVSIIPVAFVANIVRVMTLVLVTYHMGDAAGQGFLHGFAGIVLFIVALCLFFGLDRLLGLFDPFQERKRTVAAGGKG